jgi:predicted membrane protein
MADEVKNELPEEPSEMESEEEQEESYGLLSRMIGVFIEPSKAFKNIAQKPEIWGALIFVFVILLASSLFTMNMMVPLSVKSAAETMSTQGLAEDAIDKASVFTEWATRLQAIFATISILVIWLVYAGVITLVGLIMGQEASFKPILAISAYSSLPGVLIKQGILTTYIAVSRSWTDISEFQKAAMGSSLSLYSIFGNSDMNTKLQALLLSIDPFLIWSIILLTIGLKFANRTSTSKSFAVALIANIILIAAMVPLTAMGLAKLNA